MHQLQRKNEEKSNTSTVRKEPRSCAIKALVSTNHLQNALKYEWYSQMYALMRLYHERACMCVLNAHKSICPCLSHFIHTVSAHICIPYRYFVHCIFNFHNIADFIIMQSCCKFSSLITCIFFSLSGSEENVISWACSVGVCECVCVWWNETVSGLRCVSEPIWWALNLMAISSSFFWEPCHIPSHWATSSRSLPSVYIQRQAQQSIRGNLWLLKIQVPPPHPLGLGIWVGLK